MLLPALCIGIAIGLSTLQTQISRASPMDKAAGVLMLLSLLFKLVSTAVLWQVTHQGAGGPSLCSLPLYLARSCRRMCFRDTAVAPIGAAAPPPAVLPGPADDGGGHGG